MILFQTHFLTSCTTTHPFALTILDFLLFLNTLSIILWHLALTLVVLSALNAQGTHIYTALFLNLFISLLKCFVAVVQSLSCGQLFATPWTAAHQASLPFTISNLGPLSWWCHPAISSFVVPFSSHLQSFPASEYFPKSQLFTSVGQNVEASVSVLRMNIQGWFPMLPSPKSLS